MSGPAIHHIVAQLHLEGTLKAKYTDAESTIFWNGMSSGGLGPFYYLGSQGPDILFFNMNDWPAGGTVKCVAKTYWEIQSFIRDLREKVVAMVPDEIWQAVDAVENAVEGTVEHSAALTEVTELAGDIKRNIEAIKLVLEAKLKDYVTDSFDLFKLVEHPQQHGHEFKEWWWFDTMHLRRTGRFVTSLMRNSRHGSPERAYALGYLTHYAADVTGHPFVNIIAGGPYRTHSQRHKVVENCQDTWAFQKYRGGEFITSNLAKEYIVNGDRDKLPVQLTGFLLKCLHEVYYDHGSPLYGKNIAADDLDVAYKCWLAWFSGVTNDVGLPLPEPYSLTAEVAEAWNRFLANLGDIADYVGESSSGGGGLWGFLKALAALIVGPILLALAIVDFIIGEIATLGAAPLRYFLSLTYQALYDSYQKLRKGLVMNGFAFPRVCDLEDPKLRHMLHSKHPDFYGRNARVLPAAGLYPSSKFEVPNGEAESHLVYPFPVTTNSEPDRCVGAPESYFSADASWYINGGRNLFSRSQYEYLRHFAESGTGGATAEAVNAKYAELETWAKRGGLGSAVALSDALYAEFLTPANFATFIDFNLDSDRGYGFKSWRKVKNIDYLGATAGTAATLNVAIETDRKVANAQDDVLDPEWSLL